MRALEHVAPTLAKGKRVKLPSAAAKTGHTVPPSSWPFWWTGSGVAVNVIRQIGSFLPERAQPEG